MNKLILNICILALLFPMACTVLATEDLTLRAKILDVGWSRKINSGFATKNIFVEFSVLNTSNSIQSFWIMKCSWQDSFRTDNDEVTFCARECVGNFPIQIELNPNDSITFTSILEAPETAYKKPVFKIGLIMISEEGLNSYAMIDREKYIKNLKTYWSNSLSVDFDPKGYRLNK